MTNTRSPPLSQAGRRHAILASRTRRLARPRGAGIVVPFVTCLVCEAGGELFGVPLVRLSRVVSAGQLAVVPSSNPALVGVTGRAGIFYHVYDLARLTSDGSVGPEGHFAMLRGSPPIALSVDRAVRVADLATLTPAEASHMQARGPAVSGFARPLQAELFEGRIISMIDPDRLVADDVRDQVEGN